MKPVRLGRWLLVPVAAAGIWAVALVSGLAAVAVLDALCPADAMISGFCTAPWYGISVDVLILADAAATAFGIVVVCGFVAPANKFTVALIAFLCGAVFAAFAATEGSMWGPFIAAAAGGSAGLVLAASRWRNRVTTS